MVLTACKRGDEIILPRNVHRSVLNALVLCGAIPVYVNPEVDQRLGISLECERTGSKKRLKEHPKAVAVLVNNPTYYGICSDLRAIVKMAHEAGMMCLVDEAHGTHFYFGGGLPVSAMEAGADMAAVSMHKKRRQSYTVESASYRSGRTCRVCASDHQSDPDNFRKLSADVESGHFKKESCTAWTSDFPSR